jgi:DNA (cytosine-5)-methyltransferase 1
MQRIARGIKKFVIDAKEPFIVCCNHGGDDFRGQGLNEPLKTITAARDAVGLVVPHLTRYNGTKGNEVRGRVLNAPMSTLNTSNRLGLVTAFLEKHYGGVVGHLPDRPIGTITAIDHHSVCASYLSKFYGTTIGSDLKEPMPTVTGQGNHLAEVRAFMIKYYGNDKNGVSLNDPIDTIVGHDRFGLVTIYGVDHRIVDIGMRMLRPRELARGNGFPDSYILTGSNSDQVQMIGNSVPPPEVAAIVKANVKLKTFRQTKSA